jgi:hypothetical protein
MCAKDARLFREDRVEVAGVSSENGSGAVGGSVEEDALHRMVEFVFIPAAALSADSRRAQLS